MKVSITARKFKARDGLKDFVHAELEVLERMSDEILDVEVVLSFQNQKDSIKCAEIIVKVPGQVITATDEAEEFEISIKSAVEKVVKQLQKLKTKRDVRKKASNNDLD